MLRVVFFPLFLLRLLLVSSPTMIGFARLQLKPWQSLGYSLMALILTIGITATVSPTLFPNAFPYASGSQTNTSAPLLNLFKPDLSQTEELLAKYLELYQLQPTDRDVLVHIAQLYEILDQPQRAQEFWTAAKHTDPNHSRFSQE